MENIQGQLIGLARMAFGDKYPASLWEAFPLETTILAMRESGNYDVGLYLSEYPDVSHSGLEPVEHFVRRGILQDKILKKKSHMLEAVFIRNIEFYRNRTLKYRI